MVEDEGSSIGCDVGACGQHDQTHGHNDYAKTKGLRAPPNVHELGIGQLDDTGNDAGGDADGRGHGVGVEVAGDVGGERVDNTGRKGLDEADDPDTA